MVADHESPDSSGQNQADTQSRSNDDILDRMMLDKKTVGGQLRFVLPTRLGHVEVVPDVSIDRVRDILSRNEP